jgi:hypothetical protein
MGLLTTVEIRGRTELFVNTCREDRCQSTSFYRAGIYRDPFLRVETILNSRGKFAVHEFKSRIA